MSTRAPAPVIYTTAPVAAAPAVAWGGSTRVPVQTYSAQAPAASHSAQGYAAVAAAPAPVDLSAIFPYGAPQQFHADSVIPSMLRGGKLTIHSTPSSTARS